MRKRMETEERDATSRASFKCPSCCKTFTDLEVMHFTKLIQFLLNVAEILWSTAVLLSVGKKADGQDSGLLGCDVFIFSGFRGWKKMSNAGEICRYIGVLLRLVKAMKGRQGSQGRCAWGLVCGRGVRPLEDPTCPVKGLNINQWLTWGADDYKFQGSTPFGSPFFHRVHQLTASVSMFGTLHERLNTWRWRH